MEHPVTEWISGVNIPSCQLMIGMGVPLHRIPDIRRLFGKDARGTGTIDFDNDPQIEPSGAPPEPCRQPWMRYLHVHGSAARAATEPSPLRAAA